MKALGKPKEVLIHGFILALAFHLTMWVPGAWTSGRWPNASCHRHYFVYPLKYRQVIFALACRLNPVIKP
jgi:hypothetical protein